MRRKAILIGLVTAGLLGFAARPALAVQKPTFIRVIDASVWGTPETPAPDPMGITYDSHRKRLIIVDSEVEECAPAENCSKSTANPPPYWRGANVFEVSLSGTMDRTVNISTKSAEADLATDPSGKTFFPNTDGFTDEPADIAYNPAGNGTYYIADDQDSRIYVVNLGANKALDASDARTSFTIRDLTSDSEGIEFGMVNGTPTLFIAAGEGPISTNEPNDPSRVHEIWRLQPGPNGVFDGPARPADLDPAVTWRSTGDDTFAHFDTCKMNTTPVRAEDPTTWCDESNPIKQADPEDVAYDSKTGTLFFTSRDTPGAGGHTIVTETTLDGDVVDTYDLGDIKKMLGSNGARPSGIVIAPASGNASERSIYLSDRGADNNNNPSPNDGRIFEFQLGGIVNRGPVLTKPNPEPSTDEGTEVLLEIAAVDAEGDYPITCAATGLPAGLSVAVATSGEACRVSGTVPFEAGGVYTTRVSATDSQNLTGTTQFTWTIRDVRPPAVPAALDVIRNTTGTVYLDWPDSPETDLAGYDVYRSASPDGPWTKLNTAVVTESQYTDSSAPAGAAYYQIEAVDKSANRSDPIPPVSGGTSQISYVGQSKAHGSGSTMVIARPSGVQTGDVMLATFSLRGGDTILPPAGWTLVSQLTRSTALVHQGIFSRTAGASEPASYTFTFVGRVSALGMIVAYRGALGAPQATASQANPEGTVIGAPAVKPKINGSVQIAFMTLAAEGTIDAPGGMFEKGEHVLDSGWIRTTMTVSDVVVGTASLPAREATASVAAASIGQVVVLSPKP